MTQYEITYTNKNSNSGIYSAVRVAAENAEQATAYYIAHADEGGRSVEVVGCRETSAPLKPSQTLLTVPEGWEPQRTADEITADIIDYFEENTDEFNACIEELDSYNGYLGDDRYYEMEYIDEFYSGSDPLELLQRAFYGWSEGEYITDQWGEQHHREFNPNADYFRYNGYGNLVSTDYKDYSDHLDNYAIEAMKENRQYIDSIEESEELAALFDELEEA